jgi:hypothetical protein
MKASGGVIFSELSGLDTQFLRDFKVDIPRLNVYHKKLPDKGEKGMEKKVKVNFQGKLLDGVEMDFKAKEEWSIVEVSDGTIIRMKPVPTIVVKVVDQYDPAGNPVYTVQTSNVMAVSAPEELKKGAGHPKGH